MKPQFNRQFIRFLLVGIINTVIGSVIMFGLYNFAHLPYWISSAFNYFFTSVLSFFLNKYFTFQNTEKSRSQMIRFAVNIMACFLLAYGFAHPICSLLLSNAKQQIRDNISMLVGMCLFTLLNYFGQKLFAFRSADP